MVVVAIVSVVGSVAIAGVARGRRGQAAPAFGRAALAMLQQSRQGAVVLKQRTRFVVGVAGLRSEALDATTSIWRPFGGTMALPSGVEMCELDYTAGAGVITPSCPVGADRNIEFASDGSVARVTDASGTVLCPAGGAPACLGLSVPFRTVDDKNHLKVFLYGMTALPRLADQW